MAIKSREQDGLVYHWSDAGKMILQVETGACYGDACDVAPCGYTYQETDVDVEVLPPLENGGAE